MRAPVFYSFARSGGTLVNQLLGAHQDCAVRSEVNPAASFKPIAEQARDWLSLIEADEAEDFPLLPYAEQVRILHRRAGERDKSLIIRDWVTANFLPDCAGALTWPSGELEQRLYLENAGFGEAYLACARAATSLPRVHLEALRARPRATLLAILRRFSLDESAADVLLETFHTFRNCTGNTALVASNESAAGASTPPAET